MKKKFNPWPYGLLFWFLFLIVVCIGFVIKTSKMNNDLVRKDYYAAGLDHNDRQVALSRTRNMENPPRIELDNENHRMIVYLPASAGSAVLELYRPNDARMDLRYRLQDNGVPSLLSTTDLHPGKWKASIRWETDGVSYFHQENLFVL